MCHKHNSEDQMFDISKVGSRTATSLSLLCGVESNTIHPRRTAAGGIGVMGQHVAFRPDAYRRRSGCCHVDASDQLSKRIGTEISGVE